MITAHSNSPNVVSNRSQVNNRSNSVKNIASNAYDRETAYRMWFRDMLWRAFPAPSDAARAEKAHKVLGCSERQVINWLRCENDPKLRFVMATLAVAGAEIVFRQSEDNAA
jgi:hypothetical protein